MPAQHRIQPALAVADFKAALDVYQPTQQKAASFQRANADPLAALASMWANLPANDLPTANGHPHGNTDSNGADNSYLDEDNDAGDKIN